MHHRPESRLGQLAREVTERGLNLVVGAVLEQDGAERRRRRLHLPSRARGGRRHPRGVAVQHVGGPVVPLVVGTAPGVLAGMAGPRLEKSRLRMNSESGADKLR